MPSKNDVKSVLVLSSSANTAKTIADLLGNSVRTVQEVLRVDREIVEGRTVDEIKEDSDWSKKTCEALVRACREVDREQADGHSRGVALKQKLSNSLDVPTNRESLHPDATKWTDCGFKGQIDRRPKFALEQHSDWPWLLDVLPSHERQLLNPVLEEIAQYGKTLMAVKDYLVKLLPQDLSSPNKVKITGNAREAVVVAFLYGLVQSPKLSTSFLGQPEISKADLGQISIQLGAWRFELAGTGEPARRAAENIREQLSSVVQRLEKSPEATAFQDQYENADRQVQELRNCLD